MPNAYQHGGRFLGYSTKVKEGRKESTGKKTTKKKKKKKTTKKKAKKRRKR